jgi:hypothetical protein
MFCFSKAHAIIKKLVIICNIIVIKWKSRNVVINPCPIFVLGNQKSGTSIIAALLAEITELSLSLDLKIEYLSKRKSYPLVLNGEKNFSQLIERNKLDFSRDIIKEANLTIFFDNLKSHFPQSQYVFVLRNPKDNIRSILNRLDIPGDLSYLGSERKKEIPFGWQQILDGVWLESHGKNYIEVLSERWNFLADIYLKNTDKIILIRYEDFIVDKVGEITRLAKKLGLNPVIDISQMVDIQYQPKGNRNVNLESFFGQRNLMQIEQLCGDRMKLFQY